MDFKKIHKVYFVGIGGIGMSALARYFLSVGCTVAVYDRTSTPLTDNLIEEGCAIHFEDNIDLIPERFKLVNEIDQTLVVYTPAIPKGNSELNYFKKNNFRVKKRSQVLGEITEGTKLVAVAGTHGKTTISSFIAHILITSQLGCTAFLGGISKNYSSNYISGNPKITVAEADEFDRSFLWLHPHIAIITSIDSDHLDIYKNNTNLKKSFSDFANNIEGNGILFLNNKAELPELDAGDLTVFSYSIDRDADFYANYISIKEGKYYFDFKGPGIEIPGLLMNFPGRVNIENAIAAIGASLQLGVKQDIIREAVESFKGIQRRFDIRFRSDRLVYIDDYAHHPVEIKSTIESVKELFQDQELTGIFQPHLYSRTRDLYEDFAKSLEELDKLILLDIYPAREEPVPGVTSELILNMVSLKDKEILSIDEVIDYVKNMDSGVLLTLGAGDIDKLAEPIESIFKEKNNISIVES